MAEEAKRLLVYNGVQYRENEVPERYKGKKPDEVIPIGDTAPVGEEESPPAPESAETKKASAKNKADETE